MYKKEIFGVIVIVLVVYAFGFYISSRAPQIEIIYPEQDTILSEQDYQIETTNGIIIIGKSTWDEVIKVFPDWKNLGMSTIMRPANQGCLLTFSEDENILIKIHIDGTKLTSPRGIKVGDSYTKILEKYGNNFTQVKKVGQDRDFDMIYGLNRENSVTFKISNNIVERIIIQREIQ